jgi:ATP-dependent helicase HrpB
MQWPDLSDEKLLADLELWFKPFALQIKKQADFKSFDLMSVLSGMLSWPLPKHLDELAPLKCKLPSGNQCKIDYLQSPPALKMKLQEMFGARRTPQVAQGKVSLMLHLLSPAQRPLQITQDIEGFWSGSYQEIKKEMKGRYPKHPWPDEPWNEKATAFTKARLAKQGK